MYCMLVKSKGTQSNSFRNPSLAENTRPNLVAENVDQMFIDHTSAGIQLRTSSVGIPHNSRQERRRLRHFLFSFMTTFNFKRHILNYRSNNIFPGG